MKYQLSEKAWDFRLLSIYKSCFYFDILLFRLDITGLKKWPYKHIPKIFAIFEFYNSRDGKIVIRIFRIPVYKKEKFN